MRPLRSFAILAVALGCAAQDATIVPRPKSKEAAVPQPQANIRIDTNVVLIPVLVTDALNRVITSLDQETFEIYEDKVKQKIISFGSEDAPISVGFVFDTSGSMSSTVGSARQAVNELAGTANPEDEAFLVKFSTRPELAVPFTRSFAEVRNNLTFAKTGGTTALLDGVLLAIRTMKKAHNPRKALIVISDGIENNSRYTQSELKKVMMEADVQIFSISIGSTEGFDLMQRISEPTGGKLFVIRELRDLPDVAGKIGIELRNQYVIGYTPTNGARDGKYRNVTLKLIQPRSLPPLHATWRNGYYAPTQ